MKPEWPLKRFQPQVVVNSLEGFFAHMLPDAVAAAAVPLVALAMLFAADWRLALAALAPLPLAVVAQWWFMRSSAGRMREWSALQKRIANQVGEYVRGVHVAKSFGLDARSFGELAAAVRGAVDWVAGYARGSVAGWALFVGLITANLAVVAPLGAWLHARGSLDIPTWLLFLLVTPAVLAPLLRLTFALGEQMQRAEALARINEVLAAPALAESGAARVPDGALDIAFDGLRHRYGERLALDGVGFTARAGQVTALVGPSGSGKSTLVHLIARLWDVQGGSIRLGGVDLREIGTSDLHRHVAMVFQDVLLFSGTVLENLRIGRPDASREQAIDAARRAQAHGFIMALPQGYDTVLDEGGASLSGGERQRISIARALLKDAPVLLLDEATASVDPSAEAEIQQAITELAKGRTVVAIAHRLASVRHADRILVLDRGRLVEQGRHEELLQHGGVYARLWLAQQQARDWQLAASHRKNGD